MDSSAVDTLRLWLTADKVSKPELEALFEQDQGEPLALRIIGQIAQKNGYGEFDLTSNTLETYLNEVDEFERYLSMEVSTYLNGLIGFNDNVNVPYRQSILPLLDKKAAEIENDLSKIIS